jgi:hypothetical protein
MPNLSPSDRVRLLSELASPYRGIRKFIYLAAGLSGGIGAFVFLFRVLAGHDLAVSVPSLALQVGIVAAAVGLFKLENRAHRRLQERIQEKLIKKP